MNSPSLKDNESCKEDCMDTPAGPQATCVNCKSTDCELLFETKASQVFQCRLCKTQFMYDIQTDREILKDMLNATAKTVDPDAYTKFHDHLDVCKHCRAHPFDLCAVGKPLLIKAGQELGIPTMRT